MCTEFSLGGKLDDVIHVTVDADWVGDTQRQGAQRLEEDWQLARASQYVIGQ